jgi:hypothetical protein
MTAAAIIIGAGYVVHRAFPNLAVPGFATKPAGNTTGVTMNSNGQVVVQNGDVGVDCEIDHNDYANGVATVTYHVTVVNDTPQDISWSAGLLTLGDMEGDQLQYGDAGTETAVPDWSEVVIPANGGTHVFHDGYAHKFLINGAVQDDTGNNVPFVLPDINSCLVQSIYLPTSVTGQ